MAEKTLTWEDAPDCWKAEVLHSNHLLVVWESVGPSFVWEVFDTTLSREAPCVTGEEGSLSLAQQMAQEASVRLGQAKRLAYLRTLPEGWDGQGAASLSALALEGAAAFLERVGPGVQRFYIYPTLKGGVQMEFEAKLTSGGDFSNYDRMELNFHADGRVTYWLFGMDYIDDEEPELVSAP
jgi:hypothetical protein